MDHAVWVPAFAGTTPVVAARLRPLNHDCPPSPPLSSPRTRGPIPPGSGLRQADGWLLAQHICCGVWIPALRTASAFTLSMLDRNEDIQTCAFIPATHPRPSDPKKLTALQSKGAGKARRRLTPAARLRKKCRRQVPQVQPRTPGLPCAMVLTLIRSLPGAPGLLATIAARRSGQRDLIPASGYQDPATSRPRTAVRPRSKLRCDISAATASPPRVS